MKKRLKELFLMQEVDGIHKRRLQVLLDWRQKTFGLFQKSRTEGFPQLERVEDLLYILEQIGVFLSSTRSVSAFQRG